MKKAKKARKSYKLRLKRNIAKLFKKENKSYKDVMDEFNVSERVVRTSISMSDELLNLNSDDPVLENFYINSQGSFDVKIRFEFVFFWKIDVKIRFEFTKKRG